MCANVSHHDNFTVLNYSHIHISVAPPYLLFSYYTGSYNFIQRSRLDGTERTNLYFGGRPRALSFDFRLLITLLKMIEPLT